ncbi:carboxypeptidase-like regulatory domain-containing protein [Nocardioides pantholopis]|uniref:carboxypeptidase-like regulatory domain-containing protein n=1 Tax=Nocardioides pantholopis TaxID=2483798 RepID=UPI000FD8F437|nr:carboxypeptidase-like regulatory domain-containing protein [Nocardioides pantholopis]
MQSRKFLPLVAATALALMVPSSGIPAHADSDAGYVIGTVTDSAGRALPSAYVDVLWCDLVNDGADIADANGCFDTETITEASTDRAGRYVVSLGRDTIEGQTRSGRAGRWILEAGAYGYVTAAPVTAAVTLGANTSAPTVALVAETLAPPTANVALSGLVTDAAGVPLAGAGVTAYDAAGRSVDFTRTLTDGRYYFQVEDPADWSTPTQYARSNVTGSVRLQAWVNGHLAEWSGNTRAKSRASAVPVAAYGAPAAAVAPTMALDKRGSVTGSVKLPAAGGNWGANVTLLDADGNAAGWGSTDAAGYFSIDADPGVYSVRADGHRFTTVSEDASDCATCVDNMDYFGFVAGYYGGGTSLATAKTLRVSSAASTSAGTITLTNTLRAVKKPAVKGKLAKGKKLSVTAGTWNRQTNTTTTYAWKVGKRTIGTAKTLKLSTKLWKRVAKKPGKLTVTVTATDARGELVSGSTTVKVKKALAKKAGKKSGKKDKAGKKGKKSGKKPAGKKGKKSKAKNKGKKKN